jgi:CAF1 family ribonuclease
MKSRLRSNSALLFFADLLTTSTEFYLARPYNFNLSPLSAKGIDMKLERIFSFSSSACGFLQKNGFDFGKVFDDGVPYLSRKEEMECREAHDAWADKSAKNDAPSAAPEDPATIEFVRRARLTIENWLEDENVRNLASLKTLADLGTRNLRSLMWIVRMVL